MSEASGELVQRIRADHNDGGSSFASLDFLRLADLLTLRERLRGSLRTRPAAPCYHSNRDRLSRFLLFQRKWHFSGLFRSPLPTIRRLIHSVDAMEGQ